MRIYLWSRRCDHCTTVRSGRRGAQGEDHRSSARLNVEASIESNSLRWAFPPYPSPPPLVLRRALPAAGDAHIDADGGRSVPSLYEFGRRIHRAGTAGGARHEVSGQMR